MWLKFLLVSLITILWYRGTECSAVWSVSLCCAMMSYDTLQALFIKNNRRFSFQIRPKNLWYCNHDDILLSRTASKHYRNVTRWWKVQRSPRGPNWVKEWVSWWVTLKVPPRFTHRSIRLTCIDTRFDCFSSTIVSNGHCVDNASVAFDAHRVPTH